MRKGVCVTIQISIRNDVYHKTTIVEYSVMRTKRRNPKRRLLMASPKKQSQAQPRTQSNLRARPSTMPTTAPSGTHRLLEQALEDEPLAVHPTIVKTEEQAVWYRKRGLPVIVSNE